MLIPKIFYQTFETADLVVGMRRARETWLSQSPDWQPVFHDAEQRRVFLCEHYPEDVVNAYDLLNSGAFKADLWRYCVLYKTGGVYADVDSVCLAPLDSFLRPNDRFVATRGTARADGRLGWVISNAFLAAEPGHPFLKEVIKRGVCEILAGEVDGFAAIGPSGLGMAMNTVLGRRQKQNFIPGEYANYRLFRKEQNSIFADEQKILLAEYDGYKADLSSLGIAHWRQLEKKSSPIDRVRRKVRAFRMRVR